MGNLDFFRINLINYEILRQNEDGDQKLYCCVKYTKDL